MSETLSETVTMSEGWRLSLLAAAATSMPQWCRRTEITCGNDGRVYRITSGWIEWPQDADYVESAFVPLEPGYRRQSVSRSESLYSRQVRYRVVDVSL